ncbi:ABC transporter permease [Alteromonas sp. BMJM2]|uniref:ABC transporter permease n=1 Tax=Alteromonas sp. BMJM2 TaxID=2954241 RepID=UPI0022B3216A|nr:FtsX-like permease family protein [Alteromonas sp. BMJM2]
MKLTFHSNIVHDLKGAARRWRNAKFQFFVIALSVSLLTALISVLLQVGVVVGSDRPDFVGSKAELITLVRSNMSNIVKPVKGFHAEKLEKVEGVSKVAKLGVERSQVKVGKTLSDEVNIGFLNETLIELLTLPSDLKSLENNTQSVFVTAGFWQKYLSDFNVDEKPQITIYDTKTPYIVAGIVPESMSRWSTLEIGVYAHDSQLEHFAPFRLTEREKADPQKLQDNIVYTRNYLRGAPQYYVFAKIEPGISIPDLMGAYGVVDLDVGNAVEFVEEQHKLLITEGVELNPITKNKIMAQWQTLLFLSSILLLAIVSSLLYSQIGQLIQRKKELTIKRAIGAGKADLFKECSLELLPNLIVSQVVSFGLYSYALTQMSNSETLTTYFQTEALAVDIALFIPVSLLVCLLLCAVFSLPYLSAMRRMTLSSSKSDSLTSSQLRVLKHSAFLQKVMLITSVFLMTLTVHEIKKVADANTYSLDMIEFQVLSENYVALSENFKEGNFDNRFLNKTAISFDSFVNPVAMRDTVSIEGQTEKSVEATSLHVSGNLFALANVKLLAGESEMSRDEAVVNQHLALRFAKQLKLTNLDDLLGLKLVVGGFMNTKVVKIAGIVENVPHYGFSNRERPILYKPFSTIPQLLERGFFALIQQPDADDFEEFLISWADENAGSYSIERESLVSRQLFNMEYLENTTRHSALSVSGILALLLLFNIFHISRTNLQLEEKRLGALLAIGASKRALSIQNGLAQVVPFFVTLPVVLLGVVISRRFLEDNLQVNIVNGQHFLIAVAVTFSLITLINILCAKHFLSRPISRLL